MIAQLHHMAFRCRDSEETRAFYEEVIGLRLSLALELGRTATGRPVHAMHTFFEMADGASIAFFEIPDAPFDFKPQHDFDLHVALQADEAAVDAAVAAARARGLEVRGPSDHGFIRSTYFRDPNGYVVELAIPTKASSPAPPARETLDAWTRRKAEAAPV